MLNICNAYNIQKHNLHGLYNEKKNELEKR